MNALNFDVDDILSSTWDRKLAQDLAIEIESGTGDRRGTFSEMRRFLAVKGYRDLRPRLEAAREGAVAENALIAVAHEIRRYALERPALSAAAFRTAPADCPEWRDAHERLHSLMIGILGECGLFGDAAEGALTMLRSLVRGYVLHEVMHTVVGVQSYDDAFDKALQVFVAGFPAFASPMVREGDRARRSRTKETQEPPSPAGTRQRSEEFEVDAVSMPMTRETAGTTLAPEDFGSLGDSHR
ncbi:hypothetical protein ABIB06_004467 [Bradyrhizobium sp. LB8.2]|uniref:TetR-like C-terminal domain-containing protein n=1 Tax=unclassified Bradyrhizobium TaxID=2631580 RepID=UPI003399CB82